jgi:hypothetical protein
MSQTLTVELSDEVYAAIQRQAEEANTSPAQLATLSLEQHFGRGVMRGKLRRCGLKQSCKRHGNGSSGTSARSTSDMQLEQTTRALMLTWHARTSITTRRSDAPRYVRLPLPAPSSRAIS